MSLDMTTFFDEVGTESIDRAAKTTLRALMRKETKMTVASRVKVSRVELMEHIEKWGNERVEQLKEALEVSKKYYDFIDAEKKKLDQDSGSFDKNSISHHLTRDGSVTLETRWVKKVKLPKGVTVPTDNRDEKWIQQDIDRVKEQVKRDLVLLGLSQDDVVTINARDYAVYF